MADKEQQMIKQVYMNLVTFFSFLKILYKNEIAQSDGPVEYTDCFSAEGVRPPPNECPGYDTKQSDGEVPVMLELWGMLSTPSLPLLPSPFRPGVVTSDKTLSMD